jgi:hypothetical protein
MPNDELQSLVYDDRRQQFMIINDRLQKIDQLKDTISDAKKN